MITYTPTQFTNIWGDYECSTPVSNNCLTNPYIEEVLREQANEANIYQWSYSNNIGKTCRSPWDDHHDYSGENGPTNNCFNSSQNPTSEGSYAHPFQDVSYAPPTI